VALGGPIVDGDGTTTVDFVPHCLNTRAWSGERPQTTWNPTTVRIHPISMVASSPQVAWSMVRDAIPPSMPVRYTGDDSHPIE
jgi:hypothetical protein